MVVVTIMLPARRFCLKHDLARLPPKGTGSSWQLDKEDIAWYTIVIVITKNYQAPNILDQTVHRLERFCLSIDNWFHTFVVIVDFFYPGFFLTTTSLGGRHVNGSYIRFAQRSHHHNSKQPQLVVYTDETVRVRVASYSSK